MVELYGELNHQAADPDYTLIESTYGLSSGQGQTLYNLVVAAYGRLNDSSIPALIDRVG
jgi:hypothetical protein